MPTEIGVMLPPTVCRGENDVRPYARHAEQMGIDSLWVSDHLVGSDPLVDSVVLLTAAASVTDQVRLGFGVMVLALRRAAWAAKQIASLQLLSGDRLELGVGTGGPQHGDAAWRAVGRTPSERGPLTDEALRALPGLVRGEPTAVGDDGPEVTLAPGAAMPTIWVGGRATKPVLQRSVLLADGWFPSMTPPSLVADGVQSLTEIAARHGRSPGSVRIGTAGFLGTAHDAGPVRDFVDQLSEYGGISVEQAKETAITGNPREAAEHIDCYRQVGADHLVVGVTGKVDWYRQVELLAEARSYL